MMLQPYGVFQVPISSNAFIFIIKQHILRLWIYIYFESTVTYLNTTIHESNSNEISNVCWVIISIDDIFFLQIYSLHFCFIIQIKQMYFPFLNAQFVPYYYQHLPPSPIKHEPQQSIQLIVPPPLKVEQQNQEQKQSSQNLIVDIEELKRAGYQQKKQVWTNQQDNKLLLLVDKKMKWAEIANTIPGRTIKMCYSRYKRLLKRNNSDNKKGLWTKEEEGRLVELVDIHGQSWKELAVYFENRKPKQLREHYINSLTPNLSKQAWTLQQDLLIIELYNKLGKKWKAIASYLKRRSQNQVKNRFYGRIQPLGHKNTKGKI